MSFHTIYVVIPPGQTKDVHVSPHLDADDSLRYFRMMGHVGELYACRVSTAVAADVRRKSSLPLLKSMAQAMQKVGDVT